MNDEKHDQTDDHTEEADEKDLLAEALEEVVGGNWPKKRLAKADRKDFQEVISL